MQPRVRRVSRRSTVALGFAVCGLLRLVASCGTPPSVAFEDFSEAAQKARCERLARCSLFPDEASCLSYFRLSPDVSTPAAIDAGKVTYDGEQAADCIEKLSRQSCDLTAADLRAQRTSCAGVFAGALAGGAACSLDIECASGTCTFPSNCPESGCCIGECRAAGAPGGDGATCAKDRDCQSSLVCSRELVCRKLAKEGEDCCSDRECATGLGCIGPRPAMPGTCRPLPHIGEACPYLRCADEGLRCDDGGTHTCVALGLPGASCASGADCSPYMECNLDTRTCQEVPSLGMPCTLSCRGASFCLVEPTGAGTCVAPRDNGATCESLNECASFYCFVGPVFDTCTDPPVCI